MNQSNMAPLGMAVTPHHLASESALGILREGGMPLKRWWLLPRRLPLPILI
ncbi:hypothetical protein ERHA54_09490 [Erwinia rhapontici]|nr:hypothetical protein ERHA54_09490 [Erwinia rhapontici]BCQ43485.1 hypothetical protein ERHA55_10120 [Erwinia rhapontici]